MIALVIWVQPYIPRICPPAASTWSNIDFWFESNEVENSRGSIKNVEKEIEIQRAKRSWEEKNVTRKNTKIKPCAVIALATSRVWFMGEKKRPCLRAVTSGPCDLLWWLARSHQVCSGWEDKTGQVGGQLILITGTVWCWSNAFCTVLYINLVTFLNGQIGSFL